MTDSLLKGQSLTSPSQLIAKSGHYRLVMQGDGNLVLYDRFNTARWASNTGGNGASTLLHQTDSNLVIRRNSDNVVTYDFATNAGNVNNPLGLSSANFLIQDDGNLVLYTSSSAVIWTAATNTLINLPSVTVTSELAKVAPSAVIELFELQLNALQHGVTEVYRFHAGSNFNASGELVWAGNSYLALPVEADGFEYSGNGQLPRPKIRIANLLGSITAVLLALPEGLEGAKVTRIRTLARCLDAVNFPGGVNPYGTPDPTAEFPREVYYIDRKTVENRDVVEFELAAAFDLAGVRAPKRQCIANICQWVYRSAECSYTGTNYFNENDQAVGSLSLDVCGKRLSSCQARFGANNTLPFGSFPGVGSYYQ